MISVIICSRTQDIPTKLRESIENTVGCGCEIVVIDNSDSCYNIFTAYNEGVHRAKGDTLCFCHDDILFHTQGWGNIIADILHDDSIGIVGVAGGHFLPKAPCYWSFTPYVSQHYLSTENGTTTLEEHLSYFSNGFADVVAVDGMCFFIPAQMFQKIRFDDNTFNNFHGYDMDICMQVIASGKRACITKQILIEHFWSDKVLTKPTYIRPLNVAMDTFYIKWQHILPIYKGINEPSDTLHRVDNLCARLWQAEKVRQSHAYRLGRRLIAPLRWLKGKR